MYTEAATTAQSAGDDDGYWGAALRVGIAELREGRDAEGIRRMQEAIQHLEHHTDSKTSGGALISYAAATAWWLGETDGAAEILLGVRQRWEREDAELFLALVDQWLAWVRLLQRDYRASLGHSLPALSRVLALGDPEAIAYGLAHTAIALAALGQAQTTLPFSSAFPADCSVS